MSTKKLLEEISNDCLSEITRYRFNKSLDISDKYRKGKITSLQYILDLIYHFYEKDKQLKIEFNNILSSQIEDISKLKSGDYQQGINEVLTWTQSKLNKK